MGVLLCFYYSTEYMTDIVIFPKIFQRNFLGERCGGTAALLTGLGGEVGWALRPKRPFLRWDDFVPKTDA